MANDASDIRLLKKEVSNAESLLGGLESNLREAQKKGNKDDIRAMTQEIERAENTLKNLKYQLKNT